MTTAKKTALILSGGGSDGAYEVGVMKALIQGDSPATQYRPLVVDVYSGTSTGAFNSAVMAAESITSDREGIDRLEWLWRQRLSNRPGSGTPPMIRLRGNPVEYISVGLRHPLEGGRMMIDDAFSYLDQFLERGFLVLDGNGNLLSRFGYFLDPAIYISIAPFQKLVREVVDLGRIRTSRKLLVVAATNWDVGQVDLFSNSAFTDEKGHEIVLASSAIPLIVNPVHVEGKPCVDGGLTLNTPTAPAALMGCRELHVVIPELAPKDLPLYHYQNLFDAVYRGTDIIWSQNLATELLTRQIGTLFAALKNRLREDPIVQRRIDRTLRDMIRWNKSVHDSLEEHVAPVIPAEPPDVHLYFPEKDRFGGNWLDFSAARISGLIEQGYYDAVRHDCEVSNCLRSRVASKNNAPQEEKPSRQAGQVNQHGTRMQAP